MPNVRKLAFDVIYRVIYDDAYSVLALNSTIKANDMSKLDAGFLSHLVYGVLERKILLDHVLSQYSKVKLSNIDKKTKTILEIGIFQIMFMDKVPDSAAVNECVKLSKKMGVSRSSGFINAVLRSFLRNKKTYTLPNDSDVVGFLSVKYSCPRHIVELWLDQYGEKNTVGILEGLADRAPLTIRVNSLVTTKEDLAFELEQSSIKCTDVEYLPYALNIENTGSIEQLEQFKSGKFYVQDTASQLCCEILDPCSGMTLCDVCAAPGGKSLYSAIKMNNHGCICSYDLYEHKINLINDSARRLGINIINTSVRDASIPVLSDVKYDRLLCDVPCSGYGIIRRKPEIRYKKEKNVDNLPDLQYSILCNSSAMVSIGGILVYSTCTLNNKENADIINRFLREHDDFAPESIVLPNGITRFLDEPDHMLTLLPFKSCTDGFFIAKLRKVGSDD